VTTAATDIVVRRCTVRVVRHGGWSWGPQPRRLVDQVLDSLPGLIAGQLAGLVPDGAGEDVEITEPVRIVVSLTLADLLAGRFDPLRHAAVTTEPLPMPAPAPEPARAASVIRPPGTPLPEPASAIPVPTEPATLARFLAHLFERGELGQFLALLPTETLEAWYQSLSAPPAEAAGTLPGTVAFRTTPANRLPGSTSYPATNDAGPPAGTAASAVTARSRYLRDVISAIAAQASRHAAADPLQPGDLPARFRDRQPSAGPASSGPPLLRAGATTAAVTPPRAASAADAERAAATSAGSAPAAAAATGTASGAPAGTAAAAATATGTAPATTAATGQVAKAATSLERAHTDAVSATADAEIASALPFLLLGPLARVGYLSALTPALQPVGLEAQTAIFATALAYTVLGSLERAWRRQPEDLIAATAFAGLAAPVPGPALTEFARVAGPALPALDAVITRALAEGHTEGQPLVLTAADGGQLLADREGLFPVAWADTTAGLLPVWRMFGTPPVLVAPAAAGALRGLTEAGASYVVATPPGRGERWRQLPPHRLWTNDHDDPALARHASGYRQAVDLAAQLMQALTADRAAVPLSASPALGRSLLLAAGLGLGTLAWTLWREREPTDPLLALERFSDLGARVSFEPHRVRVRLPLGPRHADLSAHGLLADVPGVPWLGGRVVEFSGG
jgi:hypothetical protein